tara:strand:- start:736 stop:1569 length:834 start_codon:yes stop_codon:yes gene_type:complete
MPELPEVESVRLGLEPILGAQISHVDWNYPNLWNKESLPPELLEGQHIHLMTRKGKYLILHTEDFQLLVHLGMSGVLLLQDPADEARAHTHLQIELKKSSSKQPNISQIVRYSDPRKFGHLHLAHQGESFKRWDKLGPDAISRQFTSTYYFSKTQNSIRDIKVYLLNQEVVAGVGNIYASEALYRSGIHPSRAASSLNLEEVTLLVKAIKWILKKSIQNRGTTFSDYKLTNGKDGAFQGFLKIFQKEGQTCPGCRSTTIMKMEQDKRSTFYCPTCQI